MERTRKEIRLPTDEIDFRLINHAFSRALQLTLESKKMLVSFAIFFLCGVLVVYFRALATQANPWVVMSLTFLPFFLCSGILLSHGIFLIRVYHDEIKHKAFTYRGIAIKSIDIMLGSFYFTIPTILIYLLLWMTLGIFELLKGIPVVGEYFALILAFAPFLLNVATLALCVLNILGLFMLTPLLALKGIKRDIIAETIQRRLTVNPFGNIVLLFVALLPLLAILGLLSFAIYLSGAVCITCLHPFQIAVEWFLVMIPFAAILTPAIIFFFNFAAESHIIMRKGAYR